MWRAHLTNLNQINSYLCLIVHNALCFQEICHYIVQTTRFICRTHNFMNPLCPYHICARPNNTSMISDLIYICFFINLIFYTYFVCLFFIVDIPTISLNYMIYFEGTSHKSESNK